jgi:hypothetical protein
MRLLLASALILGLAAAGRAAEPSSGTAAKTNLGVLLDAIRANRKALVAVNLKLTDEEAAKFWPIYDRYQKEMNALGDHMVAVIIEHCINNRKHHRLVLRFGHEATGEPGGVGEASAASGAAS